MIEGVITMTKRSSIRSRWLDRIHRLLKKLKKHQLFWLLAIYTVSNLALVILEFFKIDPRVAVPDKLPFATGFLLVLYVLIRKMNEKMRVAVKKTPGDFFFMMWWAVWYILLMYKAACPYCEYEVPHTLYVNLIFVTSIYLGTRLPKHRSKFARWLMFLLEMFAKPEKKGKKKEVARHARRESHKA
ncbi:hypothetical protein ACFL04_03920 [Patescibacteria group bacterium]